MYWQFMVVISKKVAACLGVLLYVHLAIYSLLDKP